MTERQTVGYLHPEYAASLAEFGTPLLLPNSKGWILKRPISNSPYHDAMGPYPIFVCRDWSQLHTDLDDIRDLVCLFVVTDPFGEFDVEYLRDCFPGVMTPFKQHFVTDLSQPLESFVHPHHLRNARKALRQIDVEHCSEPREFLDDWINLYQTLIDRHAITGIAAFSRASFARQLSVPGINVFRASENGAAVGMLLWYEQGDRAYYHLGAYSERGYEVGASFALFEYSLRHFCSRQLKWLNLGAGPGTGNSDSGLARFKQGWSNGLRTVYFCGKIFAREKYQQLVAETNTQSAEYFPAYRSGEFK
jgi:Acetyltransferase (GNAT) domain